MLIALLAALSIAAPTSAANGDLAATFRVPSSSSNSHGVNVFVGTLPDGATYLIKVPRKWNGTLFLYSHGVQYTPTPTAEAGPDFKMQDWLTEQGYAIAGSSYAVSGFDPPHQYPSQLALLDKFDIVVGRHPSRTIAWGLSIGGYMTALLVQVAPKRFDGSIPMCPFLDGSVAHFNTRLDHAFVLKTLLDPSLPLVNIGFGFGQALALYNREESLISGAQKSSVGRARLALAEAMVDTPDWYAAKAEPARTDYAARETNEYQWAFNWGALQDVERSFWEHLVGTWDSTNGNVTNGNFSWNLGVDYGHQLSISNSRDVVHALYSAAGLDLNRDLERLEATPRVTADHGAAIRLDPLYPNFTGNVSDIPTLSMVGTADGIVPTVGSQAYASLVGRRGDSRFLRQLWVNRPLHCDFTNAEMIAAIRTMVARLNAREWPAVDAASMNELAETVASRSQSAGQPAKEPAFVNYAPPVYPRLFDPLNPPKACNCGGLRRG